MSISHPQSAADPPDAERTTEAGTLRRVRLGLVGGFVATVVMTVFRLPVSRSLPPTAQFWATYVGSGPPDEYGGQALLLHLAYGSISGGLFGALAGNVPGDSEVASEVRGSALGVAFGLALSVFGLRVVLDRLLGVELAPDERFVFHLGHVVYGLSLGLWMGSRTAEE